MVESGQVEHDEWGGGVGTSNGMNGRRYSDPSGWRQRAIPRVHIPRVHQGSFLVLQLTEIPSPLPVSTVVW